jgi:transposase
LSGMKTYPDELKASIIARMLAPNNAYVPELAKETGIPQDTLYMWRIKARGKVKNHNANKTPSGGLSSEDKFNIVIETASMNQEELNAYCRRKGLYHEQIEQWRRQCTNANKPVAPTRADREKARQQERQIKQLQAELRRKEKALAETAALLVLKKKAQELWGDPEDDK